MDQSNRVLIFDTTLRDGQQCPGAGMNFKQNLEYARLAAELAVDVLEAGFPAASKLDFEIVRAISDELSGVTSAPTVAALCQLRDEQIDITIDALSPKAGRIPRLHVYVPVDPDLMSASLGEKADKKLIERNVHDFVKRAVSAGCEVEFSPEGYSRMGENFDFVTDLICAAVEGGAAVINCPDTIGGGCQFQGRDYFVEKMNQHAEIVAKRFPGKPVIWSMHCHNDFGLAVQNSINGVFNGPARQIEGCFNGVGERAGNTALEQVVMIIKTFGGVRNPSDPFFTGLNLDKMQQLCSFLSKHMLPQQPHWPVSGDNAARHSAGGHTNAVLHNPLVYQPFDPREIGKDISLVFGPLSGGNHAKSIIENAGYVCEDSEKAEIAQFIKTLYSERRKGITDAELVEGYRVYRSPMKITDFNYSRSKDQSEIQLEGMFFDRSGHIVESYSGKDSALAALKQAIDRYFPVQIQSHQSQSDGSGITAVSVSTIVLSDESGSLFSGTGRDQDIEISAMRALIDAVNRAYVDKHFLTKFSTGSSAPDSGTHTENFAI